MVKNSSKKPKSFLKIIKIIFALSIISLTILATIAVLWSADYLNSPKTLNQQKIIVLNKGSSLTSVARKLEQNEIIDHHKAFILINRLTNKDVHVKAGQYSFEGSINPSQVFSKITSGDVMVHKLTFAEGLMTFQMLEILQAAPYLDGEIPQDITEGELLPETYEYIYGDTRFSIVERMRSKMQQAVNFAWENRADNLPIKTKQEAVILASIVEKETSIASERKLVASVFINRLNKNMRLQTDPTVIYAKTLGKYVLSRPISKSDLSNDNPYNTYKINGLPPTPIAAPGKASIEAALNPLQSDYLYFVADGTGGHQFAKTLAQHNKNVANWRKINK